MSGLTLRAFLRDRRIYIVVYGAFGLLTAAVVQLDLWLSGSSLKFANLVYIVAFGFVGLLIFLAVDYRRQARFFRELSRILESETPDAMSIPTSSVTLEQQLVVDAWRLFYARLSTQFAEERQRTRRRLQFLSQWAHHMKTPVSVIDLELQKARKDPSRSDELIQSITEENERIGHALQALLNAIRLDDFTSDFKVEPVDLLELTRRVINDYRHTFISHGVFPKVIAPDPSSTNRERLIVRSDAKWLRLVLEQVLSNAIKYSSPKLQLDPDRNDAQQDDEQRHGQVIITFGREGNQTILEVKDNGIGIPPEDQDRIFDPFFTGSAGRQYPTSTGLGLYLAREACERLGHTIAVRSTPGHGTQVRIRFHDDASIFSGLAGDLDLTSLSNDLKEK